MTEKRRNRVVFIGYCGPSILAFILVHLFEYLNIQVFEYLNTVVLSQYTIGINISTYSAYPQFFSAAFMLSIMLIPALIIYLYPIADDKNPKGIFRTMSPFKSVIFVMIVTFYYPIFWSIPASDNDVNKARMTISDIYHSLMWFYFLVLLPIPFWCSVISAYIKTYIALKREKKNHEE